MTPQEPDSGDAGANLDLGALLAQAQSLQQRLLDAQAAVADEIVQGQAGGGAVFVRVTGALEFQEVEIDPNAVDLDDIGMLEDLVLAAIRDAVARVHELNQEAIGGLGGALGGMLP